MRPIATALLTLLLLACDEAGNGPNDREPATVVQTSSEIYVMETGTSSTSSWCSVADVDPGDVLVSVQHRTGDNQWTTATPPGGVGWTQDGTRVGFYTSAGCGSLSGKVRVLVLAGDDPG